MKHLKKFNEVASKDFFAKQVIDSDERTKELKSEINDIIQYLADDWNIFNDDTEQNFWKVSSSQWENFPISIISSIDIIINVNIPNDIDKFINDFANCIEHIKSRFLHGEKIKTIYEAYAHQTINYHNVDDFKIKLDSNLKSLKRYEYKPAFQFQIEVTCTRVMS